MSTPRRLVNRWVGGTSSTISTGTGATAFSRFFEGAGSFLAFFLTFPSSFSSSRMRAESAWVSKLR